MRSFVLAIFASTDESWCGVEMVIVADGSGLGNSPYKKIMRSEKHMDIGNGQERESFNEKTKTAV